MYNGSIKRAAESEKEQVLRPKLRSGHCPLTKYYQQRIGKLEATRCETCGEEETKDHWMECPGVEKWRRECGMETETLIDEERVARFVRRAYPKWWDPGGN